MKEYKQKEPILTKEDVKKGKKIFEYTCGYCGFLFRQKVMKDFANESKRQHFSSQIRCPYCKNFLRTWDDGKEAAL